MSLTAVWNPVTVAENVFLQKDTRIVDAMDVTFGDETKTLSLRGCTETTGTYRRYTFTFSPVTAGEYAITVRLYKQSSTADHTYIGLKQR